MAPVVVAGYYILPAHCAHKDPKFADSSGLQRPACAALSRLLQVAPQGDMFRFWHHEAGRKYPCRELLEIHGALRC